MTSPCSFFSLATLTALSAFTADVAAANISILDVPDYSWYAGCFPTATGNLMGYWDRNGFPNIYTGPTGGGVAPLNSNTSNAGIRSLWASKAGFDGRDASKPGHIDDYWEFFVDESTYSYESIQPDPYVVAGRAEHDPDCLGDFIGCSQRKWSTMDGECSGNIDAFSFNFWDKTGGKRENFAPAPQGDVEMRDIQSGVRRFANYRGYGADVFSQLATFNPEIPAGAGFTFDDLKAEINAGYPVLLFLQSPGSYSRTVHGVAGVNPEIHGMLAYGYVDSDLQYVLYRTSWGSGPKFAQWGPNVFEADLPLRGVIGFHPKPQITEATKIGDSIHVKWDGPSSKLFDKTSGATTPVHRYVIEKSDSLDPAAFVEMTDPTTDRETFVTNCCDGNFFLRVKLLPPPPL